MYFDNLLETLKGLKVALIEPRGLVSEDGSEDLR